MQAWAVLTGTVGAQKDIEDTRIVEQAPCAPIHRGEEMLLLPSLSPRLQEHVGGHEGVGFPKAFIANVFSASSCCELAAEQQWGCAGTHLRLQLSLQAPWALAVHGHQGWVCTGTIAKCAQAPGLGVHGHQGWVCTGTMPRRTEPALSLLWPGQQQPLQPGARPQGAQPWPRAQSWSTGSSRQKGLSLSGLLKHSHT